MSIFGTDHYIKFCITMFSWQKMAEGDMVKVNKITLRIMIIILIMSCVSCMLLCLCLRLNDHIFGE